MSDQVYGFFPLRSKGNAIFAHQMQQIELILTPEEAGEEAILKKIAAKKAGVKEEEISLIKPVKRSIDARQRQIKIRLIADVYCGETPKNDIPVLEYKDVSRSNESVLIIGSGPAGLFAALQCLEDGIKPIIIERGKNVTDRRRDIAELTKNHIVNPESNYCFGEGGAGTYSDGKLYTRSKKRGDVNKILNILVHHGADENILVEAHPHIGTNKLPQIISNMRQTIMDAGGEIHFNTKLTDILIEDNKVKGIQTQNGDTIEGKRLILATGHSARDIFKLLVEKKIEIETKPFALGVRIEHPQQLIDNIQYHYDDRGPYLPPASYRVVKQVGSRGVYSFCMCPGGIIAPCATSPGEVVTNGWSPSKRDNPYANSGIVVELRLEDFQGFEDEGPLKGMAFQQYIEQRAWKMGGETQTAPAQRLVDFVENKVSGSLPKTSYLPGIKSVNLDEIIPYQISQSLKSAFKQFGKKMKGYYTNEAVLHAVESRTSSPVRIPRDRETLEHPQLKGFYPCGEGAGYAGGIVSAAIDGIKCAEKCAVSK